MEAPYEFEAVASAALTADEGPSAALVVKPKSIAATT
jgi:hypothetical protein